MSDNISYVNYAIGEYGLQGGFPIEVMDLLSVPVHNASFTPLSTYKY